MVLQIYISYGGIKRFTYYKKSNPHQIRHSKLDPNILIKDSKKGFFSILH